MRNEYSSLYRKSNFWHPVNRLLAAFLPSHDRRPYKITNKAAIVLGNSFSFPNTVSIRSNGFVAVTWPSYGIG